MQEDKSHAPLNERYISLADKLASTEAKQKELASFFENDVWTFDSEENIKPGRVLRAKFIVSWKRNEDEAGSPRAKARLICQGYRPRCSWWIIDHSLTNTDTPLTRYDPEHQLPVGFLPVHLWHLHSVFARQEVRPQIGEGALNSTSSRSWWTTWTSSWPWPSDEVEKADISRCTAWWMLQRLGSMKL